MKHYYYAGGRKIELEADDKHVAVDRAVADAAGLTSGAIGGAASDLRSGVVLSEKSSLGDKVLDALDSAGALRPVFRRDEAVLVALPEVRVEYDDPTQRKAVKTLLASDFQDVSISEETDDRLILKPASGDARDALKLANDIFEHAHPAASSVRFVQFMPKPGVKR
jgi:hypothetical protein